MNDFMTGGSGDGSPSRLPKLAQVLAVFVSGRSLNRFDAEHHNDHCLHSTISALEKFNLMFCRMWEVVPCLRGQSTVRVKRYWLDSTPENLNLARALLATWGRP